jgi:hypothetical protein
MSIVLDSNIGDLVNMFTLKQQNVLGLNAVSNQHFKTYTK